MTILNPLRIVDRNKYDFVYKLPKKLLNVTTFCMFPFKWYFNYVSANLTGTEICQPTITRGKLADRYTYAQENVWRQIHKLVFI